MEQSEPPPEMPLAIRRIDSSWAAFPSSFSQLFKNRRPRPGIDVCLSRWGFVQYMDRAPGEGVRYINAVLGDQYFLQDLNNLFDYVSGTLKLHPLATDAELDDLNPEIPPLLRMLVMNPADRRMTYRSSLETMCAVAQRNPDNGPYLDQTYVELMLERDGWMHLDLLEMQSKLGPGLPYSLYEMLKSPTEHWRWKVPLVPGHATPTVSSWRGMKHVPVHRLLWPLVKPGDPFELGGRPTRDERLCVDKTCVNPDHFMDPRRRVKKLMQGPGRGYAGAIRTGNNIPWTIEHIEVHADGHRELHCPRCGTVAEGEIAEAINWPEGIAPTSGKMYCRNCYQLHKKAIAMFTRPNSTRMPNEQRMETESERFERKGWENQQRQERLERGLRFDWDNDWSDGTSTKGSG